MYGFHCCVRLFGSRQIRDTQCGFKGFTREAARDLFGQQRITSIVFDVELVAQLEDCVDPVITGGPLHPRRFVVMGTWWLLREIEASLIRINQVSFTGTGRSCGFRRCIVFRQVF